MNMYKSQMSQIKTLLILTDHCRTKPPEGYIAINSAHLHNSSELHSLPYFPVNIIRD